MLSPAPGGSLPIDDALPGLLEALGRHSGAVLVAPPGAGKTTRVPPALIEAPWAAGGRLLVLEPRRLAARAAAERMASLRGERVGETVGLRMRGESRVGRGTRIEVVTEGVFTRLILADPTLDGVAGVLFDEVHERSLDADLGLALARDAQAGLREDLRIVAMSATLDGARFARLLGDAPVIRSEGRAFPVETRYLGRDPSRRLDEQVAEAVRRALRADAGSCLVFLPGAAEIRRVASLLAEGPLDPAVAVLPLFGALGRAEQDRAVRPAPPGTRKVVLASAIAESSLTIEGIRVVIDAGLSRVPVFEPGSGLTRLKTVRVSRASADQRRGRAGRTAPGICYRLWEKAADGSLEPFGRPEILSADLSGLLLDCAEWGVADPASLPFLDPPPRPALAEARSLLVELGALDPDGRITQEGRRLRLLPLPPRIARAVLAGAARGAARPAAELAAILVERGLGGDAVDLDERLDRFRRDRSPAAGTARALAAGWARLADPGAPGPAPAGGPPAGGPRADPVSTGALVALAFPERIARVRGGGDLTMANGSGARVDAHLPLARERFLAVADLAGRAASARVLAAAAIGPDEIAAVAGDRVVAADEIVFDPGAKVLRARRVRRLGAVVLSEAPLPAPRGPEGAPVLARGLAALGLPALPWTDPLRSFRDRVSFLRAEEGEPWPDLSDEVLAREAETWLEPLCFGRTALAEIGPEAFADALRSRLPFDLARRLDAEAPSHLEAPTGSRVPIDYAAEGGPAAAIRVQELFGLSRHPTVGRRGRALVLHLLSPASRPIQVTRDLPGFWRGSWPEVRAAMRGRYPRHPWPEDPASAEPTRRAKPRGT